MNGNEESPTETAPLLTANQSMEKLDKALLDYETSCGLPKITVNSEAEQYLNMNHGQLQKMSAELCGEAAVVLAQYGLHLQRCYNTELARMNWAAESCKRSVSIKINQYKGASYEERRMMAIMDNEYAFKLEKIRSYAQARSEKLSYISSKVEFLARTFLELQQTKRRQNNG